jgi:hypothetical protein
MSEEMKGFLIGVGASLTAVILWDMLKTKIINRDE